MYSPNKIMPSFRQIQRRTFDSDRNNLKISQDITTIGSNEKDVTAAGTAETIVASSTPAKIVDIQAKAGNTGNIAVGGSNVHATNEIGVQLTPLSSVRVYCEDLVNIYIDAEVSGEGVMFTYYG